MKVDPKSWSKFLMPPHSLTNFEILKYYQNKPKFDGAFPGNNLPKIKDGTYVNILDEFKSVGMYWIALYVNSNNIIYFDSFGVQHISKEIKKFTGNKNFITKICRIQAYISIISKQDTFLLDLLILC